MRARGTDSGNAGEILVEVGLIDEAGRRRALDLQRRDGGTLARAVQRLGLADEQLIARAIADWFGFDFLATPTVAAPVRDILPLALCQARRIVPLAVVRGMLRLAMADPLDLRTIQTVETTTNLCVVPVVAPDSAIGAALDQLRLHHAEPVPAGRVAASPAAVATTASAAPPAGVLVPVVDDSAASAVAVGVDA